MKGNGAHGGRVDVEVETVFVHVADALGGADVLDGLRARRSEIVGVPQAPRLFRPWRL